MPPKCYYSDLCRERIKYLHLTNDYQMFSKISVFTAKKLGGFSFSFSPVTVYMSFSLSPSLLSVCSAVNTKCHNHKIFQKTSASSDDKVPTNQTQTHRLPWQRAEGTSARKPLISRKPIFLKREKQQTEMEPLLVY